jgi:DNA polymerase I-like protein with 3'-5' exonuclease and polymerase domains
LVNLPGVDKPWGKEIRGCLVAPEGYTTCGADMVSLESTTKKHFIYPYDPEYVEEMSVEGFDEHLDLAVKAGDISSQNYHDYIYGEMPPDKKKQIKGIRTQFKPINYSAVYGVGVPKLVRSTGMTSSKAGRLLHAYWERNWAVKAFAEDQEVKTLDGQMWVKNPVNGFWYTLRYKKDIFSTVNQGTGAYCFDQWVFTCLEERESIVGQFHDESANYVKFGEEEEHTRVLKKSIDKVNEKLNLNVLLDIDVKYGQRYAEVH